MGIVVGFVLVLFVPTCFLLPIIILLQDSKGEGLSSTAFGGSGMQSILGGRGAATFLSKLTTWLAIGFMVMSFFLMRFYGETERELKPLQQEASQLETAITPDETGQETTASETAETSEGAGETSEASDSSEDTAK